MPPDWEWRPLGKIFHGDKEVSVSSVARALLRQWLFFRKELRRYTGAFALDS
jgi:hypothetical protein